MLRMWFEGLHLSAEICHAILFGPAPPMKSEREYLRVRIPPRGPALTEAGRPAAGEVFHPQ